MPKSKVSVALERSKVDEARRLVDTGSVSELIDIALTRLIAAERERRHVLGYERVPQGTEDVEWAEMPRRNEDIADDTDWAGPLRLGRRRLEREPVSWPVPRRGDVWLADLPGDKVRPVVVMTRTALTRHLHSVIVAPVTSTVRDIASEVPLSTEESLRLESVVNFDNLQLLARSCLLRHIGSLGPDKLGLACQALRQAVDC